MPTESDRRGRRRRRRRPRLRDGVGERREDARAEGSPRSRARVRRSMSKRPATGRPRRRTRAGARCATIAPAPMTTIGRGCDGARPGLHQIGHALRRRCAAGTPAASRPTTRRRGAPAPAPAVDFISASHSATRGSEATRPRSASTSRPSARSTIMTSRRPSSRSPCRSSPAPRRLRSTSGQTRRWCSRKCRWPPDRP